MSIWNIRDDLPSTFSFFINSLNLFDKTNNDTTFALNVGPNITTYTDGHLPFRDALKRGHILIVQYYGHQTPTLKVNMEGVRTNDLGKPTTIAKSGDMLTIIIIKVLI